MDLLDSLPTIGTRQASYEERNAIDKYFKAPPKAKTSWQEAKIIIACTVMYLLLSTSYTDTFLDHLPNTSSWLIRYGLKAILFFVSSYIFVIILG